MNYTALTLQLLPEVILVATALLVMGVAVASHARRRRELSARVTMALALAGVLLAGLACARQRTPDSRPSCPMPRW